MRSAALRSPALLLLFTLAVGACTADRLPSGPRPGPRARAAVLTGATIVVNSAGDPGAGGCDDVECTLREAIAAVDAGGTVTVPAFDIALASQLTIDRAVTIQGAGEDATVIRGSRVLGNRYRALHVGAAGVTVEGMTITGGYADGPAGCVSVGAGTLTLRRVRVSDCTAYGAGGGIGVSGAGARLALDRVTVSGNWAANGGGGVYIDHNATASIVASTLSGNEGREGGGLGTTGHVDIENSTISGNRARAHGGGLYAADRGLPGVQVRFATIALNVSDADADGSGDGGGVFDSHGTMQLVASIVSGNTDRGGQAPDCGADGPQLATMTRGIVGSLTGCGAFALAQTSVGDPLLAALAANGGATATHALGAGSPAIDAAGAPCPATDQRGIARPQGAACDVGAVEYVAPRLVVAIDIRPGTTLNPISLRTGGTVPVAILSTATFDARLVDVSSVTLAGAPVATRPDGTPRVAVEDVNGDGRADLLLFFDASTLGLALRPTTLTLLGALTDGLMIEGSDAVTIVP